MSLLRRTSTSAALIAFRLKRFNRRTTVKLLVPIKYVKGANHLGSVQNSKRTRKTSQQTSRHTHLENLVYTTNSKRNNFIVFKMKGIL